MANSDARDYVLAFENNKPEATRIASQTSEQLQNGSTKLIEVIRASGEYINDPDPKIRERATNYLTAVISALPPKFLTRQDIAVLNAFLCARIADGGAIEGLTRLQSLDRYMKENAQDTAQAILNEFAELQSRPQSFRFKVYTLLNDLLGNHREAMRGMGARSLLGTLHVVAGEKDPRNLMLIFSMLRVFMIEWDISNHVNEVFDAVYAYFPVTFRPPPNDPYGITAQDLKDRLKDCLASSGVLAPLVFPNLFDRLDSTSEVVKKDVLQALAACALNYVPSTLAQFSISIWDRVKYEVLQAQEPFLAEEALIVIKNIAVGLSKSTGPHASTPTDLIQYLKPVNKECLEHLQEPASRQANASGDILKAAASATIESFELVLKAIGPALFTLQQSSDGVVNQRAILSVVNQLFEASIEVYGSWAAPSEKNTGGHETLIAEFKDKLVAIYSRALMGTVKEEVSYRLTAARGLLLLAQMRALLDENETGLVVQHFNEIVLDEESYGRDELKQRAIHALADISTFKPRLITDITFPRFIARLPEDEVQATQSKDYPSVLEGLAEISIGKDLLETLVRRLLNKLDILFQTSQQADYPYTCAILSTIYYVLDKSAKDATWSLDGYFDRVVVGLSRKAVGGSGPLANEKVLNLLGRTFNLVIRRSSNEHKDEAARNVYKLFTGPMSSSPSAMDVDKASMVGSIPEVALILSTWVLAAQSKSSRSGILGEPLVPLVAELTDRAKSSKSSASEQACLKQIAILVNKHITSREDLAHIEKTFNSIQALLQSDQSAEDAMFLFNVRHLFALAKALALRLVPSTNHILTTLVSLLDHLAPARTRYIAAGFSTLLAQDEILSKTNEAQIRLLAPQRIFQTLVPIFSTKFREQASKTSDEALAQQRKEIYLIALSGILGTVSSDIVMPELPTLLPLLLQALEISDANQNVKVATLETLTVVITNNPAALIESGHIPALCRRLVAVATLPKPGKPAKPSTNTTQKPSKSTASSTSSSSSPKIRQLAVRCIGLLPAHITTTLKSPNPLLQLKKEVLQGLLPVLDDPKRDVRNEAVHARARWLRRVDGDGEESDEE